MVRIDLTGQQIGELYVINKAPHRYTPCGHKMTLWNCRCKCGKVIQVPTHDITSGHTKHCKKCGMQFARKHGDYQTRLYNVYREIKRRCYTPSNHNYPYYGGRGISMCDEWKNDYLSFKQWAISQGYDERNPRYIQTIDRIDTNGDYSPQNCRLADYKQQSNNKRTSHFITYNGETHTVTEWAEKLNVPPFVFFGRISYGWSDEKVLSTPYVPKKRQTS